MDKHHSRGGRQTKQYSMPPRRAVVYKWMITGVIGLANLTCLVGSSLSFIEIATKLPKEKDKFSSTAFPTMLLILLIPNGFHLSRSLWNTMHLLRAEKESWVSKTVTYIRNLMDYQKRQSTFSNLWDELKWVKMISTKIFIPASKIAPIIMLESFGLCIFAFRILPLQLFGISGLLASTCFLLVFSIFYRYNNWYIPVHPKTMTVTDRIAIVILLVSTALSVVGGSEMLLDNLSNIWCIPVAVLCLAISWCPSNQQKLTTTISKTEDIESEQLPTLTKMSQQAGRVKILPNEKLSIVIPIFRMLCILIFSSVFNLLDKDISTSDEFKTLLTEHFKHTDMKHLMVTIVFTSACYYKSVFACRVSLQRGAFVLPLLFAIPLVFSVLSIDSVCNSLTNMLRSEDEHMCMKEKSIFDTSDDLSLCKQEKLMLNIPAIVCLFLAICLSFGYPMWKMETKDLSPEEEIFWSSSFPGILLMEWMIASRKITRKTTTEEKAHDRPDKINIFICTTMYRETRHEMQKLLKSIKRIQRTSSDSKCFQFHIFFDGGICDKTPTDFALQLMSLLPETLGCKISSCDKYLTPYGMQLTWELPLGEADLQKDSIKPGFMKFALHLKDNQKVKNKKRWSQIMYMAYILDFLSEKNVLSTEPGDNRTFILTTDADVDFTPNSIDVLVDAMMFDDTVGAVCARTYPVGLGPLVWYQKFEYAIGHWCQKPAEHVLGSVLCAPGCFSIYRVQAIRDVVGTFASEVEKAFDFLTKDMGEDRWCCTLLVQSGWKIEYSSLAKNFTHCPEEFDEFYKQRRRWIASTMANLILLVREWRKTNTSSYRVSLPFLLYQSLLLLSALISPSVIVLIVSCGLYYAWALNGLATVIVQCVVCVAFTFTCLFYSETTQLIVAKLLTFLYACVMLLVIIGSVHNLAIGFQKHLQNRHLGTSDLSDDIQSSLTSMYLGSLITFYIISGVLHPNDFMCLVHGFWYLICLPSGYLILNIYSVCNITDRSWGTREKKSVQYETRDIWSFLESVTELLKSVFLMRYDNNDRPESTINISPCKTILNTPYPIFSKGPENLSSPVYQELNGSLSVHKTFNRNKIGTPVTKVTDCCPLTIDQWLNCDFRDKYAPLFKKHGYENTILVSGMSEKDLHNIGIRKRTHVKFLMDLIQTLPEYRINRDSPSVLDWLRDIGLEQCVDNFEANNVTKMEDLDNLKYLSQSEIRTMLKLTKTGHISRLTTALQCLQTPTHEEIVQTEVKQEFTKMAVLDMSNTNPYEYSFWNSLRTACLTPGTATFGYSEELMEQLEELRNNFLLTMAVSNILWFILTATLATRFESRLYGTDPVGLLFIGLFQSLFVIQFIGMLAHRVITLGHFCVRTPYRFNTTYKEHYHIRRSAGKLEEIQIGQKEQKICSHEKTVTDWL